MSSKSKIVLSEEQEEYLRKHYPTDAQCDIAEYLCVSPPVVRRIAAEFGLKRSASYDVRNFHNRYVKSYTSERYRNF